MVIRITVAVITALALGAGVAVAASHLASSAGTAVCVNDTNGLMRAASTCREGEHALTIGGGGNVTATQHGTFTVPWGESGTGKVLPLTGVTVSGRCETLPPFPDVALARILIEAPSGTTMDAFTEGGGSPGGSPVGRASILTRPISSGGTALFGDVLASIGTLDAIVTSNGASATMTLGGYVDTSSKTCVYLWQAVEVPN